MKPFLLFFVLSACGGPAFALAHDAPDAERPVPDADRPDVRPLEEAQPPVDAGLPDAPSPADAPPVEATSDAPPDTLADTLAAPDALPEASPDSAPPPLSCEGPVPVPLSTCARLGASASCAAQDPIGYQCTFEGSSDLVCCTE
jgi:hypothetical protein